MRFFLGSNTPKGFVSHFQTAYDIRGGWRVWVIKGGAGTGKSGMMKKIAKAAEKVTDTQWVYCSSDPDSLDAVILPEKKKMILDGTAPHIVEPKLVGACENIVNVGAYWNSDYLYTKADEIFGLNSDCSRCHSRASRYINAANTFNSDSSKMLKPYFNSVTAIEYADKIADETFGAPSEKSGSVSVRLVSAVTPKGVMFFDDSLREKCGKIIAFQDEYGVAAPIFEHLAQRATECGHDLIVCPCSMNQDKIEHIIIPGLSLAFTASNRYHSMKADETVDISEFIDPQAFERHREKLRFNSAAADGLFEEASVSMTEAKKIHDRIEEIFIESMNFEQVDRITQELIEIIAYK